MHLFHNNRPTAVAACPLPSRPRASEGGRPCSVFKHQYIIVKLIVIFWHANEAAVEMIGGPQLTPSGIVTVCDIN